MLLLSQQIIAQNTQDKTRAACPQTCNTCDFLTTTLNAIESILEQPAQASPCAAMPILVTSGTHTINAPGTYCLTGNFDGSINITHSDVTLDLNGFSISGALPSVTCEQGCISSIINPDGDCFNCNDFFSNITIRNGYLSGIDIGCCNGVQLLDLVSSEPILFQSSNYILLDNVIVVAPSSGDGCDINNCQNVQIKNSVFNNNESNGLSIIASSNLLISKSIFNNNGQGFFADTNTTNIILFDCVASANSDAGFKINGTNFSLDLCTAMNNNILPGFLINGSIGTITNCNAIGTNESDGFDIFGQNITVSNNQANNNSGYGFAGNYPTTNTTHFYSNAACNNSLGNYIAVNEPQLQLGNPNFAAGFNLSN